jgi:hypothetical protein
MEMAHEGGSVEVASRKLKPFWSRRAKGKADQENVSGKSIGAPLA